MAEDAIRESTETLKAEFQEMLGGHETLKEALGLTSDHLVALAVYARELVQQGKVKDAETLLEGLVALDMTNAYLHTALGCVYMRGGKREEAKAQFAAALELDEKDITASTYLGELLLEDGDLARAQVFLKNAVDLDPEGTDPYANRARTLGLLVAYIGKQVQERGPEALEEIRQRVAQLEAQQGKA